MFPCPRCHREIVSPDAQSRYCKYCGLMFVSPCVNPACRNSAVGIIIEKDSYCSQCGALYRYCPADGAALLTMASGPFHCAATSAAAPDAPAPALTDLLPGSGAALPGTALLARQSPRFPFPAESAPASFDGSGLCVPVARHGKIYVIARRGRLLALDCHTLAQASASWSSADIPGWTADGLTQAELSVSESAVCVRWKGRLYGYDAGSGRPLFEVRLDDFTEPSAFLHEGRLLLAGQKNGQHYAQIYTLETLREPGTAPKKPLWEGEIPGYAEKSVARPAAVMTACGAYFYLLAPAGELLAIPCDGGEVTAVFENHAGRGIFGWALSETTGALLLSPADEGADYGLAAFTPGTAEKAAPTAPVRNIQVRSGARSLLVVGADIVVLSANNRLYRLPANNPAEILREWPLLDGLPPDTRCALSLLQWAGRSLVVAHCREQMTHRFRCLDLDKADENYGVDLDARPHKQDEISLLTCGDSAYVCNRSRGHIERLIVA